MSSINRRRLSGEDLARILAQGDQESSWQKDLAVLLFALANQRPMSIEELYEKGREGGKEALWKSLESEGKGNYARQSIQKLGQWISKDLSLYASLAAHYNKLSPGMKYLLLREILQNSQGNSQAIWTQIGSKLPSEEEKQLLGAMLWEEKDQSARLTILGELKADMINWPLYEKALKIDALKDIAKTKILELSPKEKTIPLLLHLLKK
ncbi:MAG: hypothetical protein HUU50_14540 [Candidatus Brocadiae bacterium]|nr:hypothetical protein [Candidatus Brocadiia bacterium]